MVCCSKLCFCQNDPPMHTVSLQIFRSLSFPIIFHLQVSALHTFFVKIQHSYLYFNDLTIFISFKIAKCSRLFHKNHQLLFMAAKCVEVYLGKDLLEVLDLGLYLEF